LIGVGVGHNSTLVSVRLATGTLRIRVHFVIHAIPQIIFGRDGFAHWTSILGRLMEKAPRRTYLVFGSELINQLEPMTKCDHCGWKCADNYRMLSLVDPRIAHIILLVIIH